MSPHRPPPPLARSWIWGVGPVLLLPTASDDLLTADQWAAGPTVVALRQQGLWTMGALANHLVAVMATRQGHAEDLVIPIGRGLEESVDLRGGHLVRLVDGA